MKQQLHIKKGKKKELKNMRGAILDNNGKAITVRYIDILWT